MKNKKKIMRVLIIACVVLIIPFICFDLYRSIKGYKNLQAKEYMLDSIQAQIDKNIKGKSYRSRTVEISGENFHGYDGYVVNAKSDMEYVKNIFKHAKPLFAERAYAPTNTIVFVGGINIGYVGGGVDYFWIHPNEPGSYGVYLPMMYNAKLWNFLKSLQDETSSMEQK